KELNVESGYPPLLRFLNESVVGRAQQVAVHAAATSALFALDQIGSTLAAERDALGDPAGVQPLLEDLERAKERAELLRERSARWQQTLGDGSQDLAVEVERDLRARLRDLTSTADEVFEEHDPADVWDDFAAWLR